MEFAAKLTLFKNAAMTLARRCNNMEELEKMKSMVGVVIPFIWYFDEEERRTLATEFCAMTDSKRQFGYAICCTVLENVNDFSLPILEAVLHRLAQTVKTRGTDFLEDFMTFACFVADTCQSMSENYCIKVARIFDDIERTVFEGVNESHAGSILRLYSTAFSATRVAKDLDEMEERLKTFSRTNMEGTTCDLFLAAKFTIDPVCKLVTEHYKDIISQKTSLPAIVKALEWFQVLSNNLHKTDDSKEVHQLLEQALFSVTVALYVVKHPKNAEVVIDDSLKDILVANVDQASDLIHDIGTLLDIGIALGESGREKEVLKDDSLKDILVAKVDQDSDLIHDIGTLLDIGIALGESGREKEAIDMIQLCCKKAWEGVLVFSKKLNSKQDDVLKHVVDNLVTLAYTSSANLLPPLYKHDGTQIRKIVLENICSWSEAQKLCDKIRHPISLIDLWIQNQCNDKQHLKARDRTIYSLMKSFNPDFQHEALSILTHQEYQRYKELNIQNSKFCEEMQRTLKKILIEDIRSTDYILDESRCLIEEARRWRACGADFLSKCEISLSSALRMTNLYLDKESNLSDENKRHIQTQVAQAYCLRALCTHEKDPTSQRPIRDIIHALDLWCVEHAATPSQKNVTLLYYMYDLLAVKGDTSHHSKIYEKMIKLFSLKNGDLRKFCVKLWESRRLTHDLCGSPICQDFLTKVPKDCEWRTSVDAWKEGMEEINKVGYEHKLTIPASISSIASAHQDQAMYLAINQVIQLAKDLITSDPESNHHQFIVGHMYYDLAQTLIGKGAMVEALFFAKEAIKLRGELVKKKFYVAKHEVDTGNVSSRYFEIRPEVATEAWSHDVADDIILTPWLILESYLLSTLQCGLLEKNAINAERYLEDGKLISSKLGLPIFSYRFSCALANFFTKKQSKYTLAIKELDIAEKILNGDKMKISCLKCKTILGTCIKHESGDVYLRSKTKTRDNINHALSCYKVGAEMLKEDIWENEFSTPKKVSGKKTTLCQEVELLGHRCANHDEKCLHCQPSMIRNNGSLQLVVYMKNEYIRRHLLSELLERMGECFRAQRDFDGEQKVLLERLSLLLSRKTLKNRGATVAMDFITTIVDKRLRVFGFAIDYAAVLYETCCFFLRNSREGQMSKQKTVSALKTAFTLSCHAPTLNLKISRLLVALYYDEKDKISTEENGLSVNQWISYFHQTSVGTHFNSRVHARMIKNVQDPIEVDYIEQNLDERVRKFFSELPEVPIVCISMYRDDAKFFKALLPPSQKSAWIQLSRLRVNKEPIFCILPIESIITGSKFLRPEYSLPVTKPRTIVDELAPIFSSLIRKKKEIGTEIVVKKMSPQVRRDWCKMLDLYLREILSDMETTWFPNQKETILGDLEGERLHRTPIILVVDSELMIIPFESMPLLKREEVYRMPSVMSIISTLKLSRHLIETDGGFPTVDLNSVYYVMNPKSDPNLKETEEILLPLFVNFKGEPNVFPSQELLKILLETYDIFLFDGHGTELGDMCSDKLLDLERCSAVVLTACSSGALKLHGSYEPWGYIAYYLFSGSPAMISYLWPVSIEDSDLISKAMYKYWKDNSGEEKTMGMSVVKFRKKSRYRYYEAAGLVCYGVPTYIK